MTSSPCRIRRPTALSKREESLLSLAAELGYICVPTQQLVKELVLQVLKRMKHRTEANPYQSAAFHLPTFPLAAAKTILPEAFLQTSTPTSKTWVLNTPAQVASVFGPLMAAHAREHQMTGGASKGMKSKSQQWVRVLATIMTAELSWVAISGGTDRLHINFMYVLSDETGELSFPKDSSRREVLLPATIIQSIRQQVLADAASLMARNAPLSAGWYEQLGHQQKAMEVRALQANFLRLSASSSTGLSAQCNPTQHQVRRRQRADLFEVETIVEAETRSRHRGVWVRWSGYDPDWEAWRVEGRGQVGDPLVTWEPERSVRHTQAYQDWLQRMEPEPTVPGNDAASRRA